MAVTNMFDSPILKPPFVYILIAVIAVIVIIFAYRRFHKKGIEHCPAESIETVIQDQNFKKYFNTFGRKTRKGHLHWNNGVVKIGRTVKFNTILDIPANRVKDVAKEARNKNKPINLKPTQDTFNFLCLEEKTRMMRIPILNKLCHPDYFVLEDKTSHVQKDKYTDSWIISDNIHMHLLAGVWIGTAGAESLLTELIYKRTYEHEKEIEMNTPKRFVWYNDMYANKMTGQLLQAQIEDDKFRNKMRNETGG